MTLSEVSDEYARQYKLQMDSYENGKTIYIDYNQIELMIKKAAKESYNFSDKLIDYLYSHVYADKHSCFGDVIWGMDEMCEFVKNLPKD